jgi:hypothetical protein
VAQAVRALNEIALGSRTRKDMGDLHALAQSIRERGLLHPPVVTPSGLLVVGARRYLACRDILELREIPVNVLDVDSLLAAERDENEVRKEFTPSERVAITEAIVKEIGDRHGQRTDLFVADELPDNCREVQPGVETLTVAAKAAGFSTDQDFRRARKAMRDGIPEVVQAMDRGEIAVSRAARISSLPREEQPEALRKARGPRRPSGNGRGVPPPSPDPPTPTASAPAVQDGLGNVVPENLADVFAARQEFARALSLCSQLAGELAALALSPGGAYLARRFGQSRKRGKVVYHSPHLKDLAAVLRDCRPHAAACPRCGDSPRSECPLCHGLGWLSSRAWKDCRRKKGGPS